VRVVHQAGRGRDAVVRELYRSLGGEAWATVVPFIDDVPEALKVAQLVIGRAGASAVAEFCAVGRPSLLIPYPFAGDHQRFNAHSLEERGAAVCILTADATEERLAVELDRLAGDPAMLPRMAEAARSLGRPRAATEIARDLLALAGASSDGDDAEARSVPSPRGSQSGASAEAAAEGGR
jgi:UDP-N-acetylglucosamine--N-acetylmuramyl-(pentapeptide) pyrophosphoryl-undecaprenol N-acetylglucosamine transferase